MVCEVKSQLFIETLYVNLWWNTLNKLRKNRSFFSLICIEKSIDGWFLKRKKKQLTLHQQHIFNVDVYIYFDFIAFFCLFGYCQKSKSRCMSGQNNIHFKPARLYICMSLSVHHTYGRPLCLSTAYTKLPTPMFEYIQCESSTDLKHLSLPIGIGQHSDLTTMKSGLKCARCVWIYSNIIFRILNGGKMIKDTPYTSVYSYLSG